MNLITQFLRNLKWRAFLFIAAASITCLSPALTYAENNNQGYKFGVFPHLPPRELEKIFAPMAAEFSNALGKPVSFNTSSSFENFIDRLNEESFDIVFVQPFDYVTIADKFHYVPLATRDEELSAVFAVLPDGSAKTLRDLVGKKLALPPSVAAVSYLIKNHLRKNGIDPDKDITVIHQRSHISCMQQVLIRAVDACGTAAPPLRFFEYKMRTTFSIIEKTESIPHTLFAAHPRVSPADQQIIQSVILSWGRTPEGRKLLERGKLIPFKKTSDKDYDQVRKLKLTYEK